MEALWNNERFTSYGKVTTKTLWDKFPDLMLTRFKLMEGIGEGIINMTTEERCVRISKIENIIAEQQDVDIYN